MGAYVLGFEDVDKTTQPIVGGKGANLGELTKIEGIRVPEGFCVSTAAYRRILEESVAIEKLLEQLAHLEVEEQDAIAEVSGEIRRIIEGTPIPQDIEDEVTRFLSKLGENNAYAIRSSATAEDLPTASFAGQQDTYLNIVGKEAILKHISKCWASLFTERAVIYRLQNGFDHRKTFLAVVVQKMIFPQAAGTLFTADPVTSNRKVTSIDAGLGLGEAVVSGLVNPDIYKVRNGEVVEKTIATKRRAMVALRNGGTQVQEIALERQNQQTLTDAQILRLEQTGRKIEQHFGHPQDIEWCLTGDAFSIVQSRPITTLYPVPETDDGAYHVYISVAHQQMMTDAMKPLGLSIFQLTAGRPMFKAGGRLFVDVANMLASPAGRASLLAVMGQHDPRLKDALTTLIRREDAKESLPKDGNEVGSVKVHQGMSAAEIQAQAGNDPTVVADLIEQSRRSIEALAQRIQTKSGSDLFEFILEDIEQLKKSLSDPQSMAVIFGAMNALLWINDKMMEWLGEKNVADTLSQSVPNNVTSEMGLALLDVADVIRPYPEVVAYLQQAEDERFLDELDTLEGGQQAKDAISGFLDRYGMRCSGEIDITAIRWREKPTTLLPVILGNIKNFEPNASRRKFEQGLREAQEKEQQLLEQLRQLPDGEQKAEETKRMIALVRNFAGFREYPKFAMTNRYFVYKQALLREAKRLVQAQVIREKEDIYFLSFEELRDVVRTHQLDDAIIDKRKEKYEWFKKLTPPRVMTSDGEIITGEYKRENLPAGAIVGLPVSSGTSEGRARVILNMEEADLEDGDILVTAFTDPSWTPLFVSIKGLVTEVGGLMTHGAVIAREYGLPAVVGVDDATRVIRDGQRIRVHGTEGYVEILE